MSTPTRQEPGVGNARKVGDDEPGPHLGAGSSNPPKVDARRGAAPAAVTVAEQPAFAEGQKLCFKRCFTEQGVLHTTAAEFLKSHQRPTCASLDLCAPRRAVAR